MDELSENEKKDFMIENCVIYTMYLNSEQNFYLSFYSKDPNIQQLIEHFIDKTQRLDIDKINATKGSETYSIDGIPSTIEGPKDAKINKIIKDFSKTNFFTCIYLIIDDNTNQFFIDFDIDNFFNDESKTIVGLILMCSDEIKEWFSSNDMIEIEIKTDDAIKGSAVYDFITKINENRDSQQQGEQELSPDQELDQSVEEEDKQIKHKKKGKKNYHEEAEEERPILGKKRKRNVLSDSQVNNDTLMFLAKLRECVELDDQSQKKQRPALEKLKFISQIEKFLANALYQKAFLNVDGLMILQEWLKKNLDGTYPALNQLTKILDVLTGLHSIALQHLKNCQIGGFVMDISKNMKHSKTIQKKASDLIQKWSRVVYSINIDYGDIESENTKYKEIFQKDRKFIDEYDDDPDKQNEEDNEIAYERAKELEVYNHAKIPKKGLFDFIRKPISNIDESKVDDNRIRYSFLEKKKKNTSKKKDD